MFICMLDEMTQYFYTKSFSQWRRYLEISILCCYHVGKMLHPWWTSVMIIWHYDIVILVLSIYRNPNCLVTILFIAKNCLNLSGIWMYVNGIQHTNRNISFFGNIWSIIHFRSVEIIRSLTTFLHGLFDKLSITYWRNQNDKIWIKCLINIDLE